MPMPTPPPPPPPAQPPGPAAPATAPRMPSGRRTYRWGGCGRCGSCIRRQTEDGLELAAGGVSPMWQLRPQTNLGRVGIRSGWRIADLAAAPADKLKTGGNSQRVAHRRCGSCACRQTEGGPVGICNRRGFAAVAAAPADKLKAGWNSQLRLGSRRCSSCTRSELKAGVISQPRLGIFAAELP